MYKIYGLGAVVVLLLTACGSQPQTTIRSFGYDIQMKHTVRNPEVFALYPEDFFTLDSLLVVVSPRIGTVGFGRLISLRTFQEVGKFGSRGKGPNEAFWPTPLPYKGDDNDSSFMAYDIGSRSLITYTLQCTGDSLTMRADNKRRVDQGNDPMQNNLNICRLGAGHYMGVCFHHKDSIFSLIDQNLNQVGYFGNSPIPEQIGNASDELQGYMVSSYGISAYTPKRLPYIGCYGMRDNKPVKLWEDDFAEKIYQVNGGALLYKSKETWGLTQDLKIGKKYIYILWYDDLLSKYFRRPNNSSPPGANVVFIYDHAGNRIARLRLDAKLSNICISDDERTMYGLTAPDYALVTFELPQSYPQN